MNWYYTVKGNHTHVRVFCNGANCGALVFANYEFDQLRKLLAGPINFLPDDEFDQLCKKHFRHHHD